VRRGRRRGCLIGVSLVTALVGFSASPAAANPLTDCFERIAVAARHVPHKPHVAVHHAVRRVRHVTPRHRKVLHKVKGPAAIAAYAHRTHYILRPKACGTNEALMTPLPTAVAPEAPELLLATLAGPAETPVGVDVAEITPVGAPPVVGDVFTPGFPGGPGGVTPTGGFVFPGTPGGPGGPGTPGGPGQPPVTPPGQPPVTPPGQPPVVTPPGPPPITPPGQPPITPPGPPPILPPGPPPIVPPPVVTPPVVTPPGGPGGVPEPATWAMLIVGFFGVGAVLRRRRALPA
jgi:hypothetical protein